MNEAQQFDPKAFIAQYLQVLAVQAVNALGMSGTVPPGFLNGANVNCGVVDNSIRLEIRLPSPILRAGVLNGAGFQGPR